MLELSVLEKDITQHSYFCLLDWLLAENHIAYSDYEAWRYCKLTTLDQQITLENSELIVLFETTEKYAKSLGLCNDLQDYYSWDSESLRLLSAANNKEKHKRLTQHWLRPQDLPQLDLFMDNSAAIAENTLADALAGRQWTQAKQNLKKLTELNPSHHRLGLYQDLLNYGEHMHANERIEKASIEGEFCGLQQEVSPLAKEILGNAARDYLAFAWRRIADNLIDVPFDPSLPKIHRSYALLQIPDWPAIEHDLVKNTQLYYLPELMETLSSSYFMQHQSAKAMLLWCAMVEKHPLYFEDAIERHKNHTTYPLWEKFWELNDGWPVSFFSAFILINEPGLIHYKDEIDMLESRNSRAIINLLQCRNAGENEIPARKQLQNVSPALLRLYLELRDR